MAADSFLELFTTLYGWMIYGIIWDVMLTTGIAFLPFVFMLVEGYITAREQSDSDELAVNLLRYYEVKFIVSAVIIILCVHPTVTINASEVVFVPRMMEGRAADVRSNAEATDDSPVTYGSIAFEDRPGTIKAPLFWALFMNVVGAVNRSIVEGLPADKDLRYLSTTLSEIKIGDKKVKNEVQVFYRDCFLSALAKYRNELPESENVTNQIGKYGENDPFWPGSKIYLTEPGFYSEIRSMELVKGYGYDSERDFDIWQAGEDELELKPSYGKPTCKQWWSGIPGENEGLKSRIVEGEYFQNIQFELKEFFTGASAGDDAGDLMIRSMFHNDPPALDSRAVDFSYGNTVSNVAALAGIENFAKNAVAGVTQIQQAVDSAIRTKNILDAAPIVQAVLILIMIAITPILFISSKYDFRVLGTCFGFYFILKFFTVLWFIAWFVDQNLIKALYPNPESWFELGAKIMWSPSKVILLNHITTFMYVGFPIAFLLLMSSVGNHAASALSNARHLASNNGSLGGFFSNARNSSSAYKFAKNKIRRG